MNSEDRLAYQKIIAQTYDARSSNHDHSAWHQKTALRLVQDAPPRLGDSVLDVATGTGFVAFHAASLVGAGGKVVGVDLSEGMLAQANAKLSAAGLINVQFVLADAESLNYPPHSFDRIYCASAFFWILDPVATLKHWRALLRPGGRLGFHALPDTSYVWVSVARQVLAQYGVSYVLNCPTGSIDRCRRLLEAAGYRNIDIRKEEHGYYIPLAQAKSAWIRKEDFSPGQHPNPLTTVSPMIAAQAQRDYETRMEELNTAQGVWNDITMYYVYGQK